MKKSSSSVLWLLALIPGMISAPRVIAQTRGLIAWSYPRNGPPRVILDPVPVEPDAVACLRKEASFLVLRADGTVVEHGGGFQAPTGLTSVTQIAAGNNGGLALHQNGTVTGWGAAAGIGAGITDIVQVAAGPAHFVILRGTGTIKVVGTMYYDQMQTNLSMLRTSAGVIAPPTLPPLTYVCCTDGFGGGVTAAGKAVAWTYSGAWWHLSSLPAEQDIRELAIIDYGPSRDLVGAFVGTPIRSEGLAFHDTQSISLASYLYGGTPARLQRNGTLLAGGSVSLIPGNPVIASFSNSFLPVGVTGISSLPPVFVSAAAAVVLGSVSTVPPERVWYQCAAANVPESFSSTALPPGLSMDAVTGRVSGQPVGSGIYDVTFTASNAAGQGQKTVKFYVNYVTAPPVNEGSRSVPQGEIFTHAITPPGTAGPLTFQALNLPSGLALEASTGIIRGVVTATGTYNITIKATRGMDTTTGALELTVTAAVPVVTGSSVTVRQGAWFYHQIAASGIPHTGFAAAPLPVGLSFTPSGVVSGRVEVAGDYDIILSASNEVGTGEATLHLSVLPAMAPPELTVTSINDELDAPTGVAVSLREALRDVPTGGVVRFAAGVLGKTIVLTRGVLPITGKKVTVAAGAPGVTVSGNGTTRILRIAADSWVELEGLTLRDGGAPHNTATATELAHGGAIFCEGVLAARDCRFISNFSGAGGGGQNGTLLLDGKPGFSGGDGGAVWSARRVEMHGCTFVGNRAGAGGKGGTNGENVVFPNYVPGMGGSGGSGGAIAGKVVILTECTFSNNSAGRGGNGGSPRFGQENLRAGVGGNGGTGGAVSAAVATLDRCTFMANAAGAFGASPGNVPNNDGGPGSGGALFAPSAALTNCTFQGNLVLETGPRTPATLYPRGGAIAAGTGMALHCTISGNSVQGTNKLSTGEPVDGRGGGIAAGSGFSFTNCIIVGNTAIFPEQNDLHGPVTLTGANLIGVGGTTAGPLHGTVAVPLAAGLAAPAWNGGSVRTMRLLPGSPALDAGLPGPALPPTDQRGYPRTSGTAPDLGALEMEATTLPGLVVRDLSIAPAGDGFLLRWGITAGSYTIEQSTTLLPQSWSPVPGVTPVLDAVEASAQATIPGNGSLQRYFRVRWSE